MKSWNLEQSKTNRILKAAEKGGYEHIVASIAIYLNYIQDESLIWRVADNSPFYSIVVDMSYYEMEENLSQMKTLFEYC
ncbi:unnamed protein product, partial [Clonostachys rosea f. rosea IK726]